MNCQEIKSVPFAEALADGRIEVVTEEVDKAYFEPGRRLRLRRTARRSSPLLAAARRWRRRVVPLLQRDGFNEVEVYEPHREPSGDFPNVPGTRFQSGEQGGLRQAD